MAPDRRVVQHSLGIMPHAIGIDHSTTRRLDDLEHRTIDVVGHASDNALRPRTPLGGPVLPEGVKVAADSATGYHSGLGGVGELSDRVSRRPDSAGYICRLQNTSGHAYAGGLGLQRSDLVPRPDPHAARVN